MNPLIITIRTKKLGVLIRDARLASHKSLEECAEAIGVSRDDFAAFERGEKAPSLPQIELLAYSLDIPLEHFWGSTAISEQTPGNHSFDVEQLTGLRQRMIGTMLRKAREEAGLSLEEVAGSAGITPDQLEALEYGEGSLPLPMLEYLCEFINFPVRDLLDVHGPVGAWAMQQRAIQDFVNLPPELQAFVSKPINRPYLELAQRLSEMSVERLRAIGEGILEITL